MIMDVSHHLQSPFSDINPCTGASSRSRPTIRPQTRGGYYAIGPQSSIAIFNFPPPQGGFFGTFQYEHAGKNIPTKTLYNTTIDLYPCKHNILPQKIQPSHPLSQLTAWNTRSPRSIAMISSACLLLKTGSKTRIVVLIGKLEQLMSYRINHITTGYTYTNVSCFHVEHPGYCIRNKA